MKLKCIIVDDEPLAIEVIESYINKLEGFEVVGTCSNALQAFEILRNQSIDLMFLDIQMPKLTGIEFLKSLNHPPKVIFTTAYRDYAIESYELEALDYLLKPISFERFLKAIGKVYKNTMHEPKVAQLPVEGGEAQDNYVFLKADKKMVKVSLQDILYIESLKDYVRVKTTDGQVITHQKISYLEEKLPEEQFIRIHRSYLVNIQNIKSYSASAIEVFGKELPIGRNYKNQVMSVMASKNSL